MNEPTTPEVPALPVVTPPEAVESAIVPVDTPAQPAPIAEPFVVQYVARAYTQSDVDAARTQGWQDAMAQIDAAVSATRAEVAAATESAITQMQAQRVSRAFALTYPPETCLALVHGVFRGIAAQPTAGDDDAMSIVVGMAGAIVAAVPRVPHKVPLLDVAGSAFTKQLVRPASAEDATPVPDVVSRYCTAEVLLVTLCRPEVVSDPELEARIGTIPDEVAMPARAMHAALTAYMQAQGITVG